MKSRFSTRDLVYIAVFGALWGTLEMTLGSYLHLIFPSLATPLVGVGTIMTTVGMVIAITYFEQLTGQKPNVDIWIN